MALLTNHIEQRTSNLISLANSKIVSSVLDVVGINYTVLDKDGNYITQNNSILSAIDKTTNSPINAKLIDAKSWADCVAIMESGERAIREEQFHDKYFLSVKQPLIENGECLGILVVSFDITDRKRAEIAKAEFLRNMNHDIRTPLTGIYSMARMLHDDETDPYKQGFLSDIVKSAERLSELLNQVLEVTNLGSYPLEITPFNVNELFAEVLDLMSAAISAKNLVVSADCPNIIINNDRFRVGKILLNLVSNAVKFTQNGYIHISAETAPKLKLTVADSGIGIPSDKLKVIFDKFTKLKPSGQSQTYTGSGLGLFIAKQYADELGGEILVESEPGKGSKFTFIEH